MEGVASEEGMEVAPGLQAWMWPGSVEWTMDVLHEGHD